MLERGVICGPLTHFEIFLLHPNRELLDFDRVFALFRSIGWIRQTQADRSRFVYYNQDTGVFFNLWMPALGAPQPEDTPEAPPEHEEVDGPETEATEGPDAGDVVLPPLTLTLPLVCPGFFGDTGVAVAEGLAKDLGLELAAGEQHSSAGEILAEWHKANQAAALEQPRGVLARWSSQQSATWYAYGAGRAQLEAELGPAGISVPRLQVALHGEQVKTLCTWEQGSATVLPRTELVLVRRERLRKGLLLTKRVQEEGLAPGERLWRMLAPFSEERQTPAPLLIFHPSSGVPQGVAAELEVMQMEPITAARRVELNGIVDFPAVLNKEASS